MSTRPRFSLNQAYRRNVDFREPGSPSLSSAADMLPTFGRALGQGRALAEPPRLSAGCFPAVSAALRKRGVCDERYHVRWGSGVRPIGVSAAPSLLT